MLTVRSARQSGLKHTHTQPEQQQRYVSAPPPSLTPPPTRVPEPHWARGHHKSRGGASERGQGLDCESDAGDQITPLAGAAELACIANKLPPLRGGERGWGGVGALLFAQCIPPHRGPRCLPFSGRSYLPNTHLSYFT